MGDEGRAATLLGALVLGYRHAARLTQQELAGRASMSVGSVRDLEQGRTRRPRPDSLAALAHALGLNQAQADELRRAGTGGPWLQVLGPLRAWRDGEPVPLGGPARRAVLGLLAVAEGAPVPLTAIVDALWPDDPPASAANVVQAHVSRLRRILEPGRPPHDRDGALIPAGSSYRFAAGPGQLDLLAFRRLTAAARASGSAGDPEVACGLYRQALDLWHGEPLADVDLLRRHPAVIGLARQRAEVVTEYARMASADGRHGEVLAVLRDLVAREPLNEQAHAGLMTALAGCGQQAEALAAYQQARRVLVEELGIEPGPELRQLHERILAGDARLGTSRPVPEASERAVGAAVPRQLPASMPSFVGRQAELAALDRMARQAEGPGAVVISAIDGMAGVGKTALALHWAHRAAERFGDGQLYVNLRGFAASGVPAAPAEAVRGFLDALGVPPERIPADQDAQAGLYRSLLADRRMLIVLDNARDENQVRPLLPASPASLVLVTSRNQLAGLAAADGARLVSLDILTHDEAVQLLTTRLGGTRAGAEPEAVDEIAALCAHLPLALAVVAARAATRPRFSLTQLAAELRGAADRLDVLDAGDQAASVRAVFSWSYRQLGPQEARVFRLLGLHPGPDISVPAAASLAAVGEPQARRLLRELTRDCLITEHAPGRYAFHDLLRAYAASQARECDSQPDRDAAVGRVLDHYLHTAAHAAVALRKAHDPLELAPPSPGTCPERPADPRQALAWFDAEHQVLLAAVTLAAETGADGHAWQLPCAIKNYLVTRGCLHELVAVMGSAVAAATRQDDVLGQALSLRGLGNACRDTGNYDQARAHLEHCLPLFQRLGDRSGEAVAQQNLSILAEAQGHYADALGHSEEALRLFQAIGHGAGEAQALNNVGWCHALLGDYQRARAFCEQAITLIARLGERQFEHGTLDTLGYIELHLGNFAQAAAHFEVALGLCREHGTRSDEAEFLTHIGDARHGAGELPQARRAWQQALAIYEDIQHPGADEVRAKLGRTEG